MKSVAAAAICVAEVSLPLRRVGGEARAPSRSDDFELASRLSFFLWGSIPDQELLDLAAAGELKKPGSARRADSTGC